MLEEFEETRVFLECLRDTRASLEDRTHWSKNQARTAAGAVCLAQGLADSMWRTGRTTGRISYTIATADFPGERRLLQHLLDFVLRAARTISIEARSCASIPPWNDLYKTTHQDVLNVLDKSIERAEAALMWGELKAQAEIAAEPAPAMVAPIPVQEEAVTVG